MTPERAAAPGLASEGGAELSLGGDTDSVPTATARLRLPSGLEDRLARIEQALDRYERCVHACASGGLVHIAVPAGFRICAACVRRANREVAS